jgi:hypothetical protein
MQKEEIKGIQIGKETIKISPFADNKYTNIEQMEKEYI